MKRFDQSNITANGNYPSDSGFAWTRPMGTLRIGGTVGAAVITIQTNPDANDTIAGNWKTLSDTQIDTVNGSNHVGFVLNTDNDQPIYIRMNVASASGTTIRGTIYDEAV